MKKQSEVFAGVVRNGQRGQTFVMVAILLPVLLGMAALVIDLGYIYVCYQQLVSATNAAALAGGGGDPQCLWSHRNDYRYRITAPHIWELTSF